MKDGGGIKWSTRKRKVRKFKLENNEEIEEPVIWNAFRTPATFVGYEVELEKEVTIGGKKVSKIQVWVLVSETASPPGAGLDDRGWCHGLTFDETIYSPGGEEVPAILEAGWEQIECQAAQKGDIIVYYGEAGNVTHTATFNGDGTFTSKGGNAPQNNKETEAAMNKTFGVPPGKTKCYKKMKK